jgi:hypothetical protein
MTGPGRVETVAPATMTKYRHDPYPPFSGGCLREGCSNLGEHEMRSWARFQEEETIVQFSKRDRRFRASR